MARFLNTQMAVVCVTLFLGYIFHYSLWLQPLELECWLRDSGVGGLCIGSRNRGERIVLKSRALGSCLCVTTNTPSP